MDGAEVIGPMTQCCFCGFAIATQRGEPLVLSLVLDDEGTQELYSHVACLKQRVHPSVPLLLPEEDDREEGNPLSPPNP